MPNSLEQVASNKCFGGQQLQFTHASRVLNCTMRFSLFLPSLSKQKPVPVLYWLSGLTCTDENFVQKAGAQQFAEQYGVAIVAPDTSPRGDGVPDDEEGAYDFGLGAGFYVNATLQPWARHYQMYDYITEELPRLVAEQFPVDPSKTSIFGHSMGGHGALTIALKNPDRYRSVSAFAPICSPMRCPWGEKALSQYIGQDKQAWTAYDATALMAEAKQHVPMLVDQGVADNFLVDQLKPELLKEVADKVSYSLKIRMQEGYDHSYFFIASFMQDHIRFHCEHFA